MKIINHSHRRSQGVESGCMKKINIVSFLEKKEAESSKNAPSLRKKGKHLQYISWQGGFLLSQKSSQAAEKWPQNSSWWVSQL